MQIKIFTIKYNAVTKKMDDEEFQNFMRSHTIIKYDCVIHNHNTPTIILVVAYEPQNTPPQQVTNYQTTVYVPVKVPDPTTKQEQNLVHSTLVLPSQNNIASPPKPQANKKRNVSHADKKKLNAQEQNISEHKQNVSDIDDDEQSLLPLPSKDNIISVLSQEPEVVTAIELPNDTQEQNIADIESHDIEQVQDVAELPKSYNIITPTIVSKKTKKTQSKQQTIQSQQSRQQTIQSQQSKQQTIQAQQRETIQSQLQETIQPKQQTTQPKQHIELQLSDKDAELYSLLRDARNRVAQRLNCACFAYGRNAQLIEIAKAKPTTAANLKKVSQFGTKQMQLLQQEFLDIIRGFVSRESKRNTLNQADYTPYLEDTLGQTDE